MISNEITPSAHHLPAVPAPGTSSSAQKTTVPKAWRALTTSCAGHPQGATSGAVVATWRCRC